MVEDGPQLESLSKLEEELSAKPESHEQKKRDNLMCDMVTKMSHNICQQDLALFSPIIHHHHSDFFPVLAFHHNFPNMPPFSLYV